MPLLSSSFCFHVKRGKKDEALKLWRNARNELDGVPIQTSSHHTRAKNSTPIIYRARQRISKGFWRTWEGASPDPLPFPTTPGTHLAALHRRILSQVFHLATHKKYRSRVQFTPAPHLQDDVKQEARISMSLSPIKEANLNPSRCLTLSRRCIIIGTRFASITAWTCCWFPAVMLDRNHTASCKIKGCEKLIPIVF